MLNIRVETAYLRGYAKQLNSTADGAMTVLRAYCEDHCKNMSGINGTLYPARLPLERHADVVLDLIDCATRVMSAAASDLALAADLYDRSDAASAESIWTSGRNWEPQEGYREIDYASSSATFSRGPLLDLSVPADRHDSKEAVESVNSGLGTVNGLIEFVTGVNLLEIVMPVMLGEWGAVRRVGKAWGEMEHAFRAVHRDLVDGLDTLSDRWDSVETGDEGASQAFDFNVRKRWGPAFEALAQMCDYCQQLCEALAQMYEWTVDGVLLLLNFYVKKIKKAILLASATRNSLKMLNRVRELIMTLKDLVTDLINCMVEQLLMFKEGFESVSAGVVMIRQILNGDLNVFRPAS